MNYFKIMTCLIIVFLMPNLNAQSVEVDTLTYGRKDFYNTIGFESKEVYLSWDGDNDNRDGGLEGYGELEIRRKRKKGSYQGTLVGKVKGTFSQGYIHGFAKVKICTEQKDGTFNNKFHNGIFVNGVLQNYDAVYNFTEAYVNQVDYKKYFKTSEMNNFTYSIFLIEVTSAPFCEDLIMGFRSAASVSFESKGKLYEFTLRLQKPNFFEKLQYKFSGNNKLTTRIIRNKGYDKTWEFIFEKNKEALKIKEPPKKIGIDQYKNTFGFWIKELPDSILNLARQQIYASAKKHNEQYNNLGEKDKKLRGVFLCEITNQIFYFEENGLKLHIAELNHDALTLSNEYNWSTLPLTYNFESSEYDFETFEGGEIYSVTKSYQILERPKMENNYTALIKNGRYEYLLKLIK